MLCTSMSIVKAEVAQRTGMSIVKAEVAQRTSFSIVKAEAAQRTSISIVKAEVTQRCMCRYVLQAGFIGAWGEWSVLYFACSPVGSFPMKVWSLSCGSCAGSWFARFGSPAVASSHLWVPRLRSFPCAKCSLIRARFNTWACSLVCFAHSSSGGK
jgi:hypothetical protein